ncbi:TMEM175 family protein [uncultured Methanoregula sp.]|uniref:TMEM175 family protein n=1 Tax=uncultured Methanoregula sp. TaxID=1005933 RepID=UPI002AAB25E8|nr:TMEM175 family protein [uncultured Methanoregula sp.]
MIEETEYHIAKNRLETLIDGIFAIAMTLLVLGIAAPKPTASQAPELLPREIFHLFPQFFIFVIAFLVLAIFWLIHHRQFHFIRIVDPRLLWINVFLLIFIVLIPFSTDMAGDYPEVPIAVLFFHVNILIVGLIFAVHWRHICRSEHLCNAPPDDSVIRARFIDTTLIPIVAVVAILISMVSSPASLLVYLVIPVIILLLNPKSLF